MLRKIKSFFAPKPKVRILESEGLYYVDVCPPGSTTYVIEEYDIETIEEAKELAEYWMSDE